MDTAASACKPAGMNILSVCSESQLWIEADFDVRAQATLQMAPMFSATWSASQSTSQAAASQSQYAAGTGGTLVSRTQVQRLVGSLLNNVMAGHNMPAATHDTTSLHVLHWPARDHAPTLCMSLLQVGPGMVRATQAGTISQVSDVLACASHLACCNWIDCCRVFPGHVLI